MLLTAAHCWCNRLSSCARRGLTSRRIAVMEEIFLSLLWMAACKQQVSTASQASSSLVQHNLKNLAVASQTAGLAHLWSCISVHEWWRMLNLPRKVYLVMSFHDREGWGGKTVAAIALYWLIALQMAADRHWRPLLICSHSLYPMWSMRMLWEKKN